MKRTQSDPKNIATRREFLKISGCALASFLGLPGQIFGPAKKQDEEIKYTNALLATKRNGLSQASGFQEWMPFLQGRVIDPYIEVYAGPGLEEDFVKLLWKDAVVPIQNVHYNAETDSHNKIWYQINENEFVHSGAIQPVNTVLNEPSNDIPTGGRLAEVTVPFTDAYWGIGADQPLAYRFYHQTTHWVVEIQYDVAGEPWYTLVEDKWDLRYYVPARHLRLVPHQEMAPLAPDIPNALKRLEIHLPLQVLIAYQLDAPVFMARIATGGIFRDGDFSTQPGNYLTFHKRPSRHMAAGNLAAGGYDLPGVPWISYFTENGVSIHGTYWHNNYGRPRSHGCINMTPLAAKWIYRWTQPVVPHFEQMVYKNFGTRLEIFDEV